MAGAGPGWPCWLVDLSVDLRVETVLDRTIAHAREALPGRGVALLVMVDDELSVVRTDGVPPRERRRIQEWARADAALLAEPRDEGGLRSHPLFVEGRSVGSLVIATDPGGSLTELEEQTLAAFAEHAAIALRNAHLFRQLVETATRDELTGLFNRRELERTLARELERSARYGEIFSVALIDLDGFKDVNDTRGHAAGDAVLRAAARTIEAACRAADVAARIGGDEFVLILPETNQFAAAALCERLRAEVERIGEVSLSWGVAEYPTHGVDGDRLLRMADAAMYVSKPNLVGGERP
jgi:diguanylate cyclase (GGDEF)-like protein